MLRQIVCYLIVLLILAPAASKISAQTAPSADPLEVDGSASDTAPQVVAQSILDLTGNPELLEGSDRKIVLNPLHVQPVTTGEALQALRVGSGGAPAPASVRPASIDEGTSLRTSDAQGEHEVARVRQALIEGPFGIPDHYAVAGDQTLNVAGPGFLGNDIDLEGEALSATVIFDNVDNGSLAAFPSGTFSYTPDPGFTGTDSFQYRFRDASFNESDPVTVTIEVLDPANRTPLGATDDYSMIAGTTLSINAPGFLGNDIDLDGDDLSATVIFDNVDNGSLAAFPSGTFTYTPDPGFSGTDSFQYRFRDSEFHESEPVTVTIHVHEANRAPVGVEDAYATLMDTPLSIPAPGFLGNDVDLDGEALSATVIADNVDNGSLSAFPSGTFTYTPAQGFTGTDSFQYGFRDASFNNAGPVTVTILVIDPVDGVPDPPPAECTITTLAEGAPYKDSGINKIDITFTNPDGITQVEFSVLDNFVASSPGFIESDPANDIWTGGPLTTVEFTLAQDDPNLTSASYFAIASSVCPKETDGSFETDFDPFVHFPVEVPAKHELAQNFPNPFNPTTTISFALPEASTVRVTVHDALGREVRTLVDDVLGAGHHTAAWDGRDAAGSAAASGVYLYRIEAGDFVDVRQMILMK